MLFHKYFSFIGIMSSLLAVTSVYAAQAPNGSFTPDRNQRVTEQNEFGSATRSEDGRQINYTQAQLTTQLAAAPRQMQMARTNQTPKDNSVQANSGIGLFPVWGFAAFGEGIGKAGIVTSELGGVTEIYVAGSSTTFDNDNYWYALQYDPAINDYKQVFVSSYSPTGIMQMALANIAGSAEKVIVVASDNGNIQLYAQKNKVLFSEIAVPISSGLTGLAVADLNSDGTDEIVASTPTHLYVYSLDGTALWDMASVGGTDIAVAQMDGDAALEIALTDGNVVDAGTQTIQWTWTAGFGAKLDAADIDDDGMAELIAAEAWHFVWAYNVDKQLPKWSIPTSADIGAIHVVDIDGDTVQELLVGEGQWGRILAYDTETQALEWSIENPEHGVTNIAVADADNDGASEILWGSGATSTGADRLYVADWTTSTIEWESIQLDGPFIGPEMGDLDGDGTEEMVVVSSESDAGYGSGRIMVFDAATLRLRTISAEIANGSSLTGVHDLKLRDLDDDGQLEILIASDSSYNGVIEAYSFDVNNSFALDWTNGTQPSGAPFHSVDASDVDGDGELEIVAGVGTEHSGSAGVFIYMYDYTTAAEEWHSLQMGEFWDSITGLALADVDYDETLEIIGMVDGGDTYVFDGATKDLDTVIYGTFKDIGILTIQNWSLISLADTTGDLSAHVYQNGSYAEIYRQNMTSGAIDGFTWDGTVGGPWIGSGGTLLLASANGPIAETRQYGTVFGNRTRLHPSSPFFLTSGSYSVMAFLPYRIPSQ